jgi:hypothetical protein
MRLRREAHREIGNCCDWGGRAGGALRAGERSSPEPKPHLLTAKQMGAAAAHAPPTAAVGRSVRRAATDRQTQPYSTTKSFCCPSQPKASPKLGRFDPSPVRERDVRNWRPKQKGAGGGAVNGWGGKGTPTREPRGLSPPQRPGESPLSDSAPGGFPMSRRTA